ncbi:YdgA family protein [Aliikangiella sp. G2MR2-5]|uniref:YdgA family protein n=1 Tax=Aliikangiella sp. G2MR2-5 TaxID=2788943 RepID=UPI0018A8A0B0|nr:YdgA family protein [Aliikangiella sp. G2MR2-5]
MKKLLIIIILLAAILLGAPFFIGSSAESQVRQMYTSIDEHPAISLKLTEYQKGWLESAAKVELSFEAPEFNEVPRIVFTQKIYHGPILWKANGFGLGIADSIYGAELPDDVKAELAKVDSINEDTFKVTTRIGFGGSFESHLALKPFSFEKDNVKLDVEAANIDSNFDASGIIKGEGHWGGMTVTKEGNEAFTMKGMTLSSNQTLISGTMFSPDMLTAGDVKFSIEQINVVGENPGQNVKVGDAYINADSSVEAGLMNFSLVFGAKSIDAIGKSFTDLIYDISFDNLDIESVQELNKLASDPVLKTNPMAGMAKIQGMLPQLVEKNPIIKINQLGVVTPEGDISSDLVFAIDQELYDANNPMTMMFAMDAKAKGHAPELFFTQMGLGGQIEQMIQQNFLVRDNGQLKFDFMFKQGQATLNGQPMPMGM